MKYRTIETSIPFSDEKQEHIVIERGDGSFESFPVDEANPRYQQFLKETEGAK